MPAMRMRYRRVAVLAAVVALAGCGGEVNDVHSRAECARKHGAAVSTTLPLGATARRDWTLQQIRTADNTLTIIETASRTEAGRKLGTVRDAYAAVHEPTDPRPFPRRLGRLVYWWASEPNEAADALFNDCVRG